MERDLKSKTFAELERLVVELGEKKYLAGYIFNFIHTRGVKDVCEITPLSKSFRSKLVEQDYFISSLAAVEKLTDPDGTVKYVFALPDGKRIESVLLFDSPREIVLHGQNNPTKGESNISRGKDRRTLCVSTQVGCAMGCVFCATGRLGLSRNLTAGEIVDQVNSVEALNGCDARFVKRRTSNATDTSRATDRRITNVVFMGMGEPLANYDAVLDAVRILNHPKGQNIGIRHLTISTCGLAEGIERLAGEDIRPRLAISLNAPTDAIRRRLMPIASRTYFEKPASVVSEGPFGQRASRQPRRPIHQNRCGTMARLFQAVSLYQRKTHNRVTFEYCMIKGVNDTALHARMLVKRLRGLMCNVNLIEYNPHKGCNLQPSGKEATRLGEGATLATEALEAPSRSRIERFAGILKESGLETTVRQKFGRSINAACGQLGSVENLE